MKYADILLCLFVVVCARVVVNENEMNESKSIKFFFHSSCVIFCNNSTTSTTKKGIHRSWRPHGFMCATFSISLISVVYCGRSYTQQQTFTIQFERTTKTPIYGQKMKLYHCKSVMHLRAQLFFLFIN